MEIPVIYIFTHDSIGVGEDGPTHQPIEQLASLRAIPGLIALRPGDANEVVEAWKVIMQLQHEPVGADPDAPGGADARPHEVRRGRGRGQGRLRPGRRAGRQARRAPARHRQRGVALRRGATSSSTAEGIKARVVSMPSWELFEHQSQEYRDGVLPPAVTARVSVEQASTFGWAPLRRA